MATEKIAGRILSRIVGIFELLLAFALLGIFIWSMVYYYSEKLVKCSRCLLAALLLGIYIISGIFMSIILILSTFTVIGLNTRKWIAVSWCMFNMIGFVGTVVFICKSGWCRDMNRFLLMIGVLIKLAVFFCIVWTYIWGLSEKILDKKLYAMPMPVSPVRRRV